MKSQNATSCFYHLNPGITKEDAPVIIFPAVLKCARQILKNNYSVSLFSIKFPFKI